MRDGTSNCFQFLMIKIGKNHINVSLLRIWTGTGMDAICLISTVSLL